MEHFLATCVRTKTVFENRLKHLKDCDTVEICNHELEKLEVNSGPLSFDLKTMGLPSSVKDLGWSTDKACFSWLLVCAFPSMTTCQLAIEVYQWGFEFFMETVETKLPEGHCPSFSFLILSRCFCFIAGLWKLIRLRTLPPSTSTSNGSRGLPALTLWGGTNSIPAGGHLCLSATCRT